MKQGAVTKLTIGKDAVALTAAFLLMITEVLSGLLRYVLDIAGIPQLVYLAKALLLVLLALKVPTLVGRKRFWLALLILAGSSMIGLSNGAGLENIAFAGFVWLPLAFGLLYGSRIERSETKLACAIWLAWSVCLLGIALDLAGLTPWKGYSYHFGGMDLEANREWGAYGVDRIAGFARLSSTLAMMVSIFALYIQAHARSMTVKLLIVCLSCAAIALTTTKTVLPAYLIGVLSGVLFARPLLSVAASAAVVATGLALPLASVLLRVGGFAQNNHMLWSLNDRLVHTWPGFAAIVDSAGGVLLGTGFGAVGAPAIAFPIQQLVGTQVAGLGVADNTALYLWGLFGAVGVMLYSGLFWVLHRLRGKLGCHAVAMHSIVLSLVVTSWTTDIIESAVASLFVGLAVSSALVARGKKGSTSASWRLGRSESEVLLTPGVG